MELPPNYETYAIEPSSAVIFPPRVAGMINCDSPGSDYCPVPFVDEPIWRLIPLDIVISMALVPPLSSRLLPVGGFNFDVVDVSIYYCIFYKILYRSINI